MVANEGILEPFAPHPDAGGDEPFHDLGVALEARVQRRMAPTVNRPTPGRRVPTRVLRVDRGSVFQQVTYDLRMTSVGRPMQTGLTPVNAVRVDPALDQLEG